MSRLVPVFAVTTFLSLSYGVLLYVNSSYLGGFFSSAGVTLIFILNYVINIFLFFLTPTLLNKFHREKLLIYFISLSLLGVIGLSSGVSALVVGISFIIYQCFLFMAFWCLDIFLEEKTVTRYTGELRGLYFTFINIGVAGGPFLIAFFGISEDLERVYQIGLWVMILPLIIALGTLFQRRTFKANKEPLELPIRAWWGNRDIRAVTMNRFVLEAFFGVMVIYAPIYLNSVIGFNWTELGVMLTIALLPFIFLELPAGELADRYWGEKEMLAVGFFITGTCLLLMPFLKMDFLLWTLILTASRIGAALVEIMSETYFFKKIHHHETGLISIFRLTRPLGLITGTAIGGLSVALLPYQAIFFVTALIVFLGLYESIFLRDTN